MKKRHCLYSVPTHRSERDRPLILEQTLDARSGVPSDDEKLQSKYDAVVGQIDDIVAHTVERSNWMIMEAQTDYLIMNQVFNASNDGIWAIDRKYSVLRVNRRLLSLLGKSISEVIGKKCYDVLPVGIACRGECPAEEIFRGNPLAERQTTFAADGDATTFNVVATPLSGLDGSTIGLVETFTDITDRVYAEELLRASNRELAQSAGEDELTKLANRRRFDAYLAREWHRENAARISLLMLDVDHFKKYNDAHGHQAGDACLKAVAEIITRSTQGARNLAVRYGGEEFAVVMPGTDAGNARRTAEKIRRSVARMTVVHERAEISDQVTVSCGIATVTPDSDLSPQKLVDLADSRLYRAKELGRNRIISK